MNFEDLTPEQQEKARACKTPEDILALCKEEGYTLSEEELDAINGAGPQWNCKYKCEDREYDTTCWTY